MTAPAPGTRPPTQVFGGTFLCAKPDDLPSVMRSIARVALQCAVCNAGESLEYSVSTPNRRVTDGRFQTSPAVSGQQSQPASKALCGLRPTDDLAQALGAGLG
jgi:hypothetical protein